MTSWIDRAIFYHVYPLGLLDAPRLQADESEVVHRLRTLDSWIPHITDLGCNVIYLGPVFSSVSHGYDTSDYREVDPRLGDNDDLIHFVEACRAAGIHVIFDGVFNHVGREFFAFRDLQQMGEASPYREWFVDVDFSQQSPLGDPFSYYAYEGNFDLVKLNLANDDVRDYLFATVDTWFETFGASGIRFDAVDVLDHDFVRAMCAHCREVAPDCWLLGEIVFDTYDQWLGEGMLDSVTNYEAYKGLWSSLNDRNLFEIAWSLNRQFGPEGVYQGRNLYAFADNHDVNRIASTLQRPKTDLALLYTVLFTMPGVPSIYYGSEWGIAGRKRKADDAGMRAPVDLATVGETSTYRWLPEYLRRLSAIRLDHAALRHGDYHQRYVESEQFAFQRQADDSVVIVAINSGDEWAEISLNPELESGTTFLDALDPDTTFTVTDGGLTIPLDAHSSRILVPA
jgi:glycosidase